MDGHDQFNVSTRLSKTALALTSSRPLMLSPFAAVCSAVTPKYPPQHEYPSDHPHPTAPTSKGVGSPPTLGAHSRVFDRGASGNKG